MPARIVAVHEDLAFLDPLVAAMRAENHMVVAFDDSGAAWDAMRTAKTVEVLITGIQFAAGKPHGIALAHWTRTKCPKVRVLFVASPEFMSQAEGLGTFLPMPVRSRWWWTSSRAF
jgi:hypothetical protein